jgi:nicotinamide riboside kinase
MLKIILTGPESCGKTTLARQLAQYFDVPLVEEYVREYFEKKQTSRRKIGTGSQYKEADLKEIAMGQIAAEKKAENALFKQLTRKKNTKKPPFFICDTDVLTIKIWSEEKYGRCDEWISEQFQISNFKFQIPNFRFQIPDFRFQIPDSKFQISDSTDLPSNLKLQTIPTLQTSNFQLPTSNSLPTSNFQLQTLYLLCSPEGIAWETDPLREHPNDRERLFAVYEKELIQHGKSYKILRGGISERFEYVKNVLQN